MASISDFLRSAGRKIYRQHGRVTVYPVSRGTWSVDAFYGHGRDFTQFKRSKLTPLEIEGAVHEALKFLAGKAR